MRIVQVKSFLSYVNLEKAHQHSSFSGGIHTHPPEIPATANNIISHSVYASVRRLHSPPEQVSVLVWLKQHRFC